MTLDKFGRHIELHKTRKYINNKILTLTNVHQTNFDELNKNFKQDIDAVKIELNNYFKKLRNIVILQLELTLQGDIYEIFNGKDYKFPCTGRVVECRINLEKVLLNYTINENKRVSVIENKNIMHNDKLKIFPYPVGLRPQTLYLEIVLETAVYYVEN